MHNVTEKRMNYPSQQNVFRYLKFGCRKEMHQKCGFPVPKQMNNKMPYNFDIVKIKSTRNGGILVAFDDYRHHNGARFQEHYSYQFEGQRVIRKQLNLTRWDDIETVFETERTMGENVKALLEFQLNRENTRIKTFILMTSIPNLDLTHLLRVTDLRIENEDTNRNLFSQIKLPVRKVSCYNIPEVHELVFSLVNRQMDSQIKFKGDYKILKAIRAAVANDSQNGWLKKYYDKVECASLTTGNQEVIIYMDRLCLRVRFMPIGSASFIAPPVLRMPFDLTMKIFRLLPYTAREATHQKPEFNFEFLYIPVRADNMIFECTDGLIKNAIVDGKTVQCEISLSISMNKKGSFIKHLIVKGFLNFFLYKFDELHVETLTLDSDEAYPETFANIFSAEALPKVIYANCQETTKHLGNLLKNAEVIYKNGHSDDGPPAKKAKLAVSDQ